MKRFTQLDPRARKWVLAELHRLRHEGELRVGNEEWSAAISTLEDLHEALKQLEEAAYKSPKN